MEINSFAAVSRELYHDLLTLQQQMQETEMTTEKHDELVQKMDSALILLEKLQKRASEINNCAEVFFSDLAAIEERIQYLYHCIENRFMDHQVEEIVKESQNLAQCLQENNMRQVAMKVDALKRYIGAFHLNNRPARRELKIIALAEQFLEDVDALLEGKESERTKAQAHLQQLLALQAAVEDPLEVDPELEEMAVELLDLAELFHNCKTGQAKKKLNELLHVLPKELRDKIKACEDDSTVLVTTLLELANEITGVHRSFRNPTAREAWFSDLEGLTREDVHAVTSGESKIVSFNPYVKA